MLIKNTWSYVIRSLFFFLLLIGSWPLLAQDEELSALETTINEEPDPTDTSVFSDRNKWRSQRRNVKAEKGDVGRAIELRSVLEEGLRRNPFERIRTQQREQIELLKTDVFQRFWLPTVALELQTSNHRIDRLKESAQNTPGTSPDQSPQGRVGLVIEDYTLFNWGRDYLQYQNEKQTLNRANQQLTEQRRRLRFALISQYFNLVRVKEILRIKQEQLRQTSFIHRLAKEKLQLRKIRAQEYYQTRSEYLRAQTEYQQALFDVGIEEEDLANLLGDEYRGSYRATEVLKYTSVGTTMDEAIKLSQEQSVDYRNAKVQYDTASRSYEKTLKDNLPLPKFDLTLGTYRQNFDRQGTSWSYETYPGSRNIDIVASIDMRWTLLGAGGFFNGRENQQSYLTKRIAEINFFNTRRELEVKVRTIYKTLRFMEQKVEIAQFQHKNAQSNYDSVLDNYMAGNTTYTDIKLAIDNLVLSHINSENVRYEHLLKKIELADFMGLEDFPGENFETLAVR